MKNNTGFACFGLLTFALLSVVVGAVMNGWVLSMLWGWFVAPLFSLPSLSIPAAIGFSLVVGMLTKMDTNSSAKKETWELVAEVIARSVLSPLFVLFIGWIIHLFM